MDFRNYFKFESHNIVKKLSSGTVIRFDVAPHSSFKNILKEISNKTESLNVNIKNYRNTLTPGLNTVLLLDLIFKIMPFRMINSITSNVQRNKKSSRKVDGTSTIPFFVNAGNIQEFVQSWGDLHPSKAYIVGQIIYHPGFAMNISQYSNNLNMSIAFVGDEEDDKMVKLFFDKLDGNLINILEIIGG